MGNKIIGKKGETHEIMGVPMPPMNAWASPCLALGGYRQRKEGEDHEKNRYV